MVFLVVLVVVKNLPANAGATSLADGETQVRFLGQEDPLEWGIAAHTSILSWRIPWTEDHGRLQSIESHRAGHN